MLHVSGTIRQTKTKNNNNNAANGTDNDDDDDDDMVACPSGRGHGGTAADTIQQSRGSVGGEFVTGSGGQTGTFPHGLVKDILLKVFQSSPEDTTSHEVGQGIGTLTGGMFGQRRRRAHVQMIHQEFGKNVQVQFLELVLAPRVGHDGQLTPQCGTQFIGLGEMLDATHIDDLVHHGDEKVGIRQFQTRQGGFWRGTVFFFYHVAPNDQFAQ
eukprot:scaffold12149_cov214-Amphora_coffeaeformis.AAC.3